MRAVAEHAAKTGVTLAVEYLNRFESYFLTCAADAARFVKRGEPSELPHDVRHVPRQHRREKRPRAIRTRCAVHGARAHFRERPQHARAAATSAGRKRSTRFRESGYDGWMVVEAFGLALPAIAAATKIWRRMYQSEEQLARDALAFMKT